MHLIVIIAFAALLWFNSGAPMTKLGLSPGPAFGRILSELYDAQLEGRVTSRREALALAPQLADSG